MLAFERPNYVRTLMLYGGKASIFRVTPDVQSARGSPHPEVHIGETVVGDLLACIEVRRLLARNSVNTDSFFTPYAFPWRWSELFTLLKRGPCTR